MKKSLIALAVLAASGAAMAQSSVTVFGVVDTGVTYVNGQDNWSGLTSGNNAASRIGFRGVEDLGGGLKANFWLEAGLNTDTGDGNAAGAGGSGLEFKRRSTVGLEGGFGEVRLGRELTAAYNAVSRYDVFGQVGIGHARQWTNTANLTSTGNRVSNMVTYVSPNFSGFKASVNYGFGEATTGTPAEYSNRASRYLGAGLTYDNGPLSLGLAGERSNRGSNSVGLNAANDITAWALGGSYNLGVVKLAAAYKDSKAKPVVGDSAKLKAAYLGLSAPVGAAGEVKASYNRYDQRFAGGEKLKADQYALGYVHNLSKRTALYGTYAFIKNKNNDGANLGITLAGNAGLKDNGNQQALQVGVRHAF